MRTRRHLNAMLIGLAIVVSAALLAACGTDRVPAPSRTSARATTAHSVALLSTETGISAVDAGTTRTRWSMAGAVSALDGSAVFAGGSGTLVRLDPRTGEEIGSWPIDATLHPFVVSPGGTWVALTDRTAYEEADPASRTTIAVVNGSSGTVRARHELVGDVEPEAFSTDGGRLIVLVHHGPTYRVQTLDLVSGELYETIDENKDAVGDMTGHRVRGVLSQDKSLLATLYQYRTAPDASAFVHVLDLGGWTYCVPLPPPFGGGEDGTVLIERSATDDVIVISEHADQRAQFSLGELRLVGSAAVKVSITPGAGARADAAYVGIPGYRALIAVL